MASEPGNCQSNDLDQNRQRRYARVRTLSGELSRTSGVVGWGAWYLQ
jgi:hypothetical protein